MQDLYYKSSGKFSPISFILLIVAVAIMPVLAAVYSAVLWYNPIIYVSFLATLAYALVVSTLFNRVVMRAGKVRNTLVGIVFGLIASAVSLVASWAIYFAIMVMNFEGTGVDFSVFMEASLMFASNPGLIWSTMQDVNVEGLYTVNGLEIQGTILWIIWGIEAAVIAGAPLIMVAGYSQEPFCEDSGKWAEKVEYEENVLPPCRDVDALIKQLETDGSAASLMDLDVIALEEDDKRPHMSAIIHTCENTAYLTLENHAGKDDEEERDLFNETIVDCLRITKDSAAALHAKLS